VFTAGNINMGSFTGPNVFVDEFALYNRALSVSDLAAHYSQVMGLMALSRLSTSGPAPDFPLDFFSGFKSALPPRMRE
jgi:hypothetical protein